MKLGLRIVLCILILTVLTSICVVPAFSNSAVRHWEGSTAYGVVMGEGQCPVEVLHETLTFDIPHFPDQRYEKYTAKVTADYTLHNPSDADITVKLAFPFGQRPNYPYGIIANFDEIAYGVSLNGQPVEAQLRHTYYSGRFELENELGKLHDSYITDDFYHPELSVTCYTYKVTKGTKAETVMAELVVPRDLGEKTKIFVPNSMSPRDEDGVHIRLNVSTQGDRQILLYVFGEPLEEMSNWTVYSNVTDAVAPDKKVELISTTQMTYYDLAMTNYDEYEYVLPCDWYNAVTDSFLQSEQDFGVTRTYHGNLDISEFLMQWYEYEITIPAGKTVQNCVTAPMFPSIDEGYEPTVYKYNYLLSPATTWASFGTLDVIINTPYYLVQDVYGYESLEGGYKKHYESLPSGELSFTLSSSENPKSDSPYAAMLFAFLGIFLGSFFIGIVAILIVIFIIILILFLIIRAIVRRKRR